MTSSRPGLHPAYRPDIDGLRAIAVAAVVLFHAFPTALPGGYVGVDIFFVISGYLISSILIKSLQTSQFSLADFYVRRVRRIFPALIVVLAATLLAGWWLLLPGEYRILGRHAAGGTVFLSNFILWREAGYFDATAETKPLLHLWSLAIEEQFYIFWPLILAAAWRLRQRAGIVLTICASASLAWSIASVQINPVAAFFSPISRAWELLAGAALAYASLFGRLLFGHACPTAIDRWLFRLDAPRYRHLASLLGILLISIAVVCYQQKTPFPGLAALLPVLGAVLIIGAGPDAIVNRLWLSRRWMVAIGLISYPLYLWHWPLLTYPRLIAGEAGLPPLATTGLVLLSMVLAWLTYALVETPIRHSAGSRRQLIGGLCGVMALVGVSAVAIHALKGLPNRSNMEPYTTLNEKTKQETAWPYAENETCLQRYPSELRSDGWWFCVMNRDAPPRIVLLGNSFANHLYPGIANQPRLGRHTILQLGTCDPAMGVRYDGYPRGHGCFGEGRDKQERFINGIIEREGSVKFAILSAPWPRFDESGNAVDIHTGAPEEGRFSSIPPVTSQSSKDALVAGVQRRVQWLVDRNITPILILGTPQLGYDPGNCYMSRPLARQSLHSCEVPTETVLVQQHGFRKDIARIQREIPQLRVFDPLTALCDDIFCSLLDAKSGLLLRDIGHLSIAGSNKVGRTFVEWAERNVPELLEP